MGEYKASVLSMRGTINPTKNRDILWPNDTQKPLKWSQRQLGMRATCISLKHKQKRHKGRGVSLPYARPQNLFFTTENPLDFSGEKANARRFSKLNKDSTKKGQTRPKRGWTTPNTKVTLMKYLKHKKIELLYVIHKAQNNMQSRLKASARMGNIKQ